MVRAASVLGWAALVAGAVGCRHDCGRGSLMSFGRGSAPCSLTGRSTEVCADPAGLGVPVSGGGMAPGSAGLLLPGSSGVGVGPAEELPPPGSTIPPTSVPLAPPMAAPPLDPLLGTLPAPKTGVPVKIGK